MPVSELRLVKRYVEFCSLEQIKMIPSGTRGLYVLLKKNNRLSRQSSKDKFDVVYIGMARGLKGGIKYRLRSHRRKKPDAWTHFSVYEVWDNITESEVEELEGLFRHIYRRDPRANKFNQQRSFRKMKTIRQRELKAWDKAEKHL
jgi:adenosyl cobinamide kinase/adenosyl cobinamide phosphate guanylyltransferase